MISRCLLVSLNLKLAISLNPLKTGFVQEILRDVVVSESSTTPRSVGGPGGTGERGREGMGKQAMATYYLCTHVITYVES